MKRVKNIVLSGAEGRPIALDIFFTGEEDKKKPVIIYAHGFNGFKDWGNFDLIASLIADAGFTFIKFNFSHNGTTPDNPEEFCDLDAFGNNNYSKQLLDTRVVVDWVCNTKNPFEQVIDTSSISLIGHSMGGGIAILYAATDRRIAKLITWAAIAECKTPWGKWPKERIEIWKHVTVQYYTNARTGQEMPLFYQLYIDYLNNKEHLDIEKAIKKMQIPMLICHGSLDISVPIEAAHQLKVWNPTAELFIVESNHTFDRQHPWVVNYLPEAMEDVLAKSLSFINAKKGLDRNPTPF